MPPCQPTQGARWTQHNIAAIIWMIARAWTVCTVEVHLKPEFPEGQITRGRLLGGGGPGISESSQGLVARAGGGQPVTHFDKDLISGLKGFL